MITVCAEFCYDCMFYLSVFANRSQADLAANTGTRDPEQFDPSPLWEGWIFLASCVNHFCALLGPNVLDLNSGHGPGCWLLSLHHTARWIAHAATKEHREAPPVAESEALVRNYLAPPPKHCHEPAMVHRQGH
eukprot:5837495-Amphidinium_carterae.1